jgi:DNA-binding transcriptional LysR family regulator
MITKGLSLDRLASFLAVVDAGGIALAAPNQPVRQSQLSRQIAELERALGTALFERGGQGPRVPTAAGAQLARVVRELYKGLDEVRALDGPLTCTLGAGDSALHWLLLPLARELDGVRLEVGARSTEEIVAELAAATLDLGVVHSTATLPEGLKAIRLGTVSYALFTPRDSKRSPLAVVTGEPTLAPVLASLGPPSLACETFPQVAAAVRAGYSGVLPTIARADLPHVTLGPVLATSTLALAWRPRLDNVRPALAPVRRRIVEVLRRALARA